MKKRKRKTTELLRHVRGKLKTMVKELAKIQPGIDGEGDIYLPIQWLVRRKNTMLELIRKIGKKL